MSIQRNSVQPTTATVVTELRRLGFSANQALVYQLLVEHGELRIPDLARLAKVPRTSVGECLKALLARGLAEEIVGETHKQYRPHALAGLKHELDEQIADIEESISALERLDATLATTRTLTPTAGMNVRYYRDVPGARQVLWNTLQTKKPICVYSAFGRSQFVGKRFYENFVLESRQRNITERVLINPTERALSLIERDSSTALARTSPKDIRTIPADRLKIRGETFVYDNIYAYLYLDGSVINGFEIESPEFSSMQRELFRALWNSGAKLAESE